MLFRIDSESPFSTLNRPNCTAREQFYKAKAASAHSQGRNRGITPGFVNTNTWFFRLEIRRAFAMIKTCRDGLSKRPFAANIRVQPASSWSDVRPLAGGKGPSICVCPDYEVPMGEGDSQTG